MLSSASPSTAVHHIRSILAQLSGEEPPKRRYALDDSGHFTAPKPEERSLAESLAALPDDIRQQVLNSIPGVSHLQQSWKFRAHPKQLEPSKPYKFLILLGGRGAGKTLAGAEWVQEYAATGKARHIALVAEDAGDARDVMITGPSGILTVASRYSESERPVYRPGTKSLHWPNGAVAHIYADIDCESLRGPQQDLAWIDELAKFRNAAKTWNNLQLGLRVARPDGGEPRCLVTTTPRPIPLLKEILADPHAVKVVINTYENVCNLAPSFRDYILRRYEGTRLGRQELHAEILEDTEGALWTLDIIDRHRVKEVPCELSSIVVAIDPAATSQDTSDDTGIVCAGKGTDGDYYVFDDLSGRYSPNEWAVRALNLYDTYRADFIVGESNNGGEMVSSTVRNVRAAQGGPQPAFRLVWASRGKRTRAEPIAALFEQGKVHHCGEFRELEDEMVSWNPNLGMRSPSRMDALTWAITLLSEQKDVFARWV